MGNVAGGVPPKRQELHASIGAVTFTVTVFSLVQLLPDME